MLCLTRRVGERIMVGPDIIFTILEIDRGRVRVGVDAPRDVVIVREELLPVVPLDPRREDA